MGGRRARSLLEIVGTGLSRQKEKFEEAIASKDPQALATSSAKLMANSKRAASIVYYAAKLSDFVRKTVESGECSHFGRRNNDCERSRLYRWP